MTIAQIRPAAVIEMNEPAHKITLLHRAITASTSKMPRNGRSGYCPLAT
jgi:hypothetical protein